MESNIGNYASLISTGAGIAFSSEADSLEGFKALVPNGIDFVYQLAQPTTVTLTATEVSTLLGQNNIWADCGLSTVEYPADTKLYIDKKLAALVAALS
jgi:hypothetical protein